MNYFNLKNILSIPFVYNKVMSFLSNDSTYSKFVNEHIRAQEGDKILDVGCGPARILNFLPDVKYVGIDMSQKYIESAKKKYNSRGKFICSNLDDNTVCDFLNYDIVLALGLIHHLDDTQTKRFFEISKKALKPEGRLITIDGCFRSKQSWLERFILSQDRGKYVRTEDQYYALASSTFVKIKKKVRNDLISIVPYTHIIMECVA